MKNIKITAGMGSIEDYQYLAKAGADEVFCGYMPVSWSKKYGNSLPINRREVFFYDVQITSLEDMKILYKMSKKYKTNVAITFNSLYYSPRQLDEVMQYISDLQKIGFRDFIIADINLIRRLCKENYHCNIHISGEIGEWNTLTIKLLESIFDKSACNLQRIIFHRKNSYSDMSVCRKEASELANKVEEFEAFFMNEKCHYTGGFCNSLHCDEMQHICQLEYRIGPATRSQNADAPSLPLIDYEDEEREYVPGESGCGICSLWNLHLSGVTHLKVVGRGEHRECMLKDITTVKTAIRILKKSHSEEEYINKVKSNLFPNGCSKNCYYIT